MSPLSSSLSDFFFRGPSCSLRPPLPWFFQASIGRPSAQTRSRNWFCAELVELLLGCPRPRPANSKKQRFERFRVFREVFFRGRASCPAPMPHDLGCAGTQGVGAITVGARTRFEPWIRKRTRVSPPHSSASWGVANLNGWICFWGAAFLGPQWGALPDQPSRPGGRCGTPAGWGVRLFLF